MDMLVPAVIGDIVSRSASFAIKKYWQPPDVEKNLARLNQLLLRAHTIIEEAAGRHITNEGMFQQLRMLIEGMYRGHYMLDTFKYRALQEEIGDEEEVSHFSTLSKFNPAKRLRFSSSYTKTVMFGSNNIKELGGIIATLENGIADMKEFVIFLGNYTPMRRQPCCTYSVLENCMFGRQMERERLLNFLLQTDDFGDEDLAVLPIIGPRKVGKSTLVEHVCRDDRVRTRYSSILFFRENDLKDEKVTNLRENSIVKHQNYASCERLLIIIELAGDISEETWIRLKSSVSCMACGGKIIITSRSSKIANLGTTEALQLDFLHPEAYWYFFKMLAFGSTNPDEQPRLASTAMEIATEYSGSFLAAYIIGGLLRDNFNAQFWCSARKYLRAYIHSQLLMFGEHPNNLLRNDQPVHCLRFAKASDHLWMSNYYETDSSQDQDSDTTITMSDIMLGCATPYGRFEALGWKSRVPPYYNYMISCVAKAPEHAVGRKKNSLRTALDLGHLISRSTSFVIEKYRQQPDIEKNLQRLHGELLRIDTIVEEAEGRHITNQGMLHQLKMLREGMHRGHYMLDTFKYQARHEETRDDEEVSHLSALSKFNPAKRVRFSDSGSNRETVLFGRYNIQELQGMVDTLENIIADMKEFVIFLESYPRIHRQPYCTYLLLDNCMFGRQVERERVLNFLLQTEAPNTDNLAVLPIVGPIRVGKSTLVEHVCKDERVRDSFSMILFLREKSLMDGGVTNLRENGVVKHQNPASHNRLLIIVELAGDIDEGTWRRLKSSTSCMESGSKIIITSRSNKIVNLGTTETLRLDYLPPEAYWHFFKLLAFGSTNPDEKPRLAMMAMEIAMELKQCFTGAYIFAGLLRDNFNAQFWCAVLKFVRAYKHKHLLLFDEHPSILMREDEPVYYWSLAKTSKYFLICNYYQSESTQEVPKLTIQDILLGNATPRGKFDALAWKSRIPPYYNYTISCMMKTPQRTIGRKKHIYQEGT